jgi:Spy/CpxP family protein refolding chaperone
MRRQIGRAVLCAGLLLGGAWQTDAQPPQTPQNQPPQRFAWWRSEQYQKNLGLSADQVNRLEALFQNVLPDLRKGRDDLDRHEAELSRLIETGADEALVTRQLDKVEAIRSHLNKTRQLVLLHHRQVLTPEQRVKLAQAERERAGRPLGGPTGASPGGPAGVQKP